MEGSKNEYFVMRRLKKIHHVAIGVVLAIYGLCSFLGLDEIAFGKHYADGRDTMAPILFAFIGAVMIFYAVGELVIGGTKGGGD